MKEEVLTVLLIFGGIFAIFFLPSAVWMMQKVAEYKNKQKKKTTDKTDNYNELDK